MAIKVKLFETDSSVEQMITKICNCKGSLKVVNVDQGMEGRELGIACS
jgi:hypothetical protein